MKEKEERLPQKSQFLKGMGIHFNLDTKSGVPFYRQIMQMVEYNMSIGKLKPGDKLPTIRALSIRLKINPNTIAKAYMGLEIRGLVQTQVGSGTYVSEKKIDLKEERVRTKKKIEEMCIELLRKVAVLGISREELIDILKNLNGYEGDQ